MGARAKAPRLPLLHEHMDILTHTLVVQHNVFWFQVSVYDAIRVEVAKSQSYFSQIKAMG